MRNYIRCASIAAIILLFSILMLPGMSARPKGIEPTQDGSSSWDHNPVRAARFLIASLLVDPVVPDDPIVPSADLAVTKSASSEQLTPGMNLTYTIVVSNGGSEVAINAMLNDPLPQGMTFVSLKEPGGWACTTPDVGDGGTVTCTNPSLLVTTDDAFILIVHSPSGTNPGTLYTNTATVTTTTPDYNSEDDTSTVTTQVAAANLSVTKVDTPDPVMAGNNLTYTITVNNAGPSEPAANLSDALPANTRFVSIASPGNWSCLSPPVGSGGTVLCSNAEFVKGSAVFTLTVATSPALTAGAIISNTATVSSTTPDPNPGNESSTATTTVLSPATLSGAKSVSGQFTPGGTVTYTVVINNSGPRTQSDNPGNEFTDVLPSSLTLVSAGASSGTATPSIATNTVAWNGSLPSGGSATITIQATIKSGTKGTTISNQGTLNYDADGNGTNESSAQTDDPSSAGNNNPTAFVVNTAPTISAVGITRTAGSAASNSTIANVSDAEDALNTLSVTVNNSSSATVNGVTVSNLLVGAAGAVTADVVAACGATSATFTLKASDGGGLGNTAALTVPVNANPAPTLTYANPPTVSFRGSLTVNPATGPSDNGSISTISVKSQGTYSGSVSVNNSTGAVSISNAAPAGTHTITIRATDNCGLTTDTSFTLNIAKADQTITFGALSGKTFGDAPFTVSATGGASGNPVTFSAQTLAVCTVSGNTVTILSAGNCTIRASQAGNSNYNDAANVNQTFTVAKAGSTTTVTSSANPSESGQSVTFTATVSSTAGTPTGTVTFKDGVNAITGCTNVALSSGQTTCITSGLSVGSHTITADYNGAANFTSSTGTLSGGQQVNIQTSVSINDVKVQEGNSGTTNAVFTVTLAQASNLSVTVNYQTADGSATNPSDYQSISGILTFNPGDLTKTITVLINGDTTNEGDETFFVNLSGAVNATTLDDQGKGTIQNDDATQLQFSISNYAVGEAAGHATITVTRTGDTSQPAALDYATSDLSGLNNCNVVTGNASQRCDYTAIGPSPLSFIAGQTSATFEIPIINDVYVEGPETLSLTLSNPVGGIIGTQSTATLTINDNDLAPGAPNPIDDAAFFIREHYLDFLSRQPEGSGLQGWLSILNNCPAGDKSCDRIGVSSGFFRSPEFFNRTYYIYRFYRTALGRKPSYDEYQRDIKLVTGFLTDAELEARKTAFAEEFVQRAEFRSIYDAYPGGNDYVNAIVATAGVTPSNQTDVATRAQQQLITRGRALRELLESPEISQRFYNEAFVVVGYFAYLRREPDALYLDWIAKLNNPPVGQSYEDTYREMIRGFIESLEYRTRFGPN